MTGAVIYAVILFFCSFMLIVGALAALKYWKSPGALMFIGLCFSSAIYVVGYSFEVTRISLQQVKYWSHFQYLGLPFIPTFLLLFIAYFANAGRSVPRILVVLCFMFSVLFCVLRQTNNLHFLFYRNEAFMRIGSFSTLQFEQGPWYQVMGIYNSICLLVSLVLTISYIGHAPKLFRRQGTLILIGLVVSSLPYALYISGRFFGGLDLMPLGLALATPFFLAALLKQNLFSLAPVGRDRVIESMADAVIVLDHSARVADTNPAALAAFAEPRSDAVGSMVNDAFPEISSVATTGGRLAVSGKTWDFTRAEIPEEGGHAGGILLVGRDITERERLIRQLELMAKIDGLTGLLNRQAWDSAVKTELSRLSRYGRSGAVVLLDIDHFKSVNDNYGHAAGDKVLTALSGTLSKGLRQPDLVARYGGEEFIIFMPEADVPVARETAERLRTEIAAMEVPVDDIIISITVSIGVAGGVISRDTIVDVLVDYADQAMYRSKQNGRNRVTSF